MKFKNFKILIKMIKLVTPVSWSQFELQNFAIKELSYLRFTGFRRRSEKPVFLHFWRFCDVASAVHAIIGIPARSSCLNDCYRIVQAS